MQARELQPLLDILLLQAPYNTSLVMIGSMVLGICAGMVGTFMFLRKRALVSDAVSHATLPGLCLGFIFALYMGWDDGRHLPSLMIGAALSGLLGMSSINFIKNRTRLSEDTATAVILGVFYGGGMVILSYIQSLPGGSRAGLDSFLLGQVASLQMNEVILITSIGILLIFISLLYFKELIMLCFDPSFIKVSGLPLKFLDMTIAGLTLTILCIGLKTIGLILIIALLIIPPATARLWVSSPFKVFIISGAIGGASCYIGSAVSSWLDNIPTGASIVIFAVSCFIVSLAIAPESRLWLYLSKVKSSPQTKAAA